MQLDWKQTGERYGNPVYEAKYVAYPTPAGDAIATAKVYPDVYFSSEIKYETVLFDPYLGELDRPCTDKYAYGSTLDGDLDQRYRYAMNVCEEYGVKLTGDSPFEKLSRSSFGTLYNERALKAIASKWCEENENAFIVEFLGVDVGKHSVDFTYDAGGYERRRIHLVVEEDLSCSVYEK